MIFAESLAVFLPEVKIVQRAAPGFSEPISGVGVAFGFLGLMGPEIILFDPHKTEDGEIQSYRGLFLRVPWGFSNGYVGGLPYLVGMPTASIGSATIQKPGDNHDVFAGKISIEMRIQFEKVLPAIPYIAVEVAQWFVGGEGNQTTVAFNATFF